MYFNKFILFTIVLLVISSCASLTTPHLARVHLFAEKENTFVTLPDSSKYELPVMVKLPRNKIGHQLTFSNDSTNTIYQLESHNSPRFLIGNLVIPYFLGYLIDYMTKQNRTYYDYVYFENSTQSILDGYRDIHRKKNKYISLSFPLYNFIAMEELNNISGIGGLGVEFQYYTNKLSYLSFYSAMYYAPTMNYTDFGQNMSQTKLASFEILKNKDISKFATWGIGLGCSYLQYINEAWDNNGNDPILNRILIKENKLSIGGSIYNRLNLTPNLSIGSHVFIGGGMYVFDENFHAHFTFDLQLRIPHKNNNNINGVRYFKTHKYNKAVMRKQ